MSRNLNPATVQAGLDTLSLQYDQAAENLVTADEEATRAEFDYELAFARALLTSKGSNEAARKAEATLACEDELWAHKVSAQKYRAAKVRVTKLERRISVGQTIHKGFESTWTAGGRGAA